MPIKRNYVVIAQRIGLTKGSNFRNKTNSTPKLPKVTRSVRKFQPQIFSQKIKFYGIITYLCLDIGKLKAQMSTNRLG